MNNKPNPKRLPFYVLVVSTINQVCQGFFVIQLPSVQFSVIVNAFPKQIYEEYGQNVTLHLFSSADKKDERCMYKRVKCNGKLLQPSHCRGKN
jgi:hypothetical protein